MDCNIVMANQLNDDTKFSVDLAQINNILANFLADTVQKMPWTPQQASANFMPRGNILPNPLAGITTRPGDKVKEIPPHKTAVTASVNLAPIGDLLTEPLAEIINIKNFPDHQAHRPNPHQSEAQKHDPLEGQKEMPWTPQQASLRYAKDKLQTAPRYPANSTIKGTRDQLPILRRKMRCRPTLQDTTNPYDLQRDTQLKLSHPTPTDRDRRC